ncbi:16S rRNA (uracil(1498)-N(3))-methyltransferase [Lentibacillus cibarius]|uniref:Ribosomal RNA small subunit methyltransferase E n=1 Tax=Lentibacillus cibarius TaxID=2583219 RepID=A0A5S3QGI2_9BACI|nr:16S rRNA (uracil(1498)-N(3))-methyltransferase [Lentibacillus cibarius]TMN21005.1 16S rRNA (uracil(1498)-N(3))-methyltransferase [Lentibacillus cibarius]
MQRYFVPAESWEQNGVLIKGDDAHHISRVMRLKAGNEVICNHPDGQAAICEITEITNNAVRTEMKEWLHASNESPISVTIAQALAKGDKFELVLQKGTELGAAAFIPVQAERSVVVWDDKKAAKKLNRYAKILKEASEQCHRNKIPQLHPFATITDLIEQSHCFDKKIFAYEEEAKTNTFQTFAQSVAEIKSGDNVLIVIGPEGGFSEQEAVLMKQAMFAPVRLGPRILRTETAAMYALASMSYHFEELGCE